EDGHDQGEERDALDEAGGHDHGAADVTGGVGLAGDAVHGGGSEAADAEASADDRESGADAGGEVRKGLGISGHVGQLLQRVVSSGASVRRMGVRPDEDGGALR